MLDDAVPIEGFKGYKIDREGNVWSCMTPNGLSADYHKLKATPCSRFGHLRFMLRKNKKTFNFKVHRLLATHFIPNSNSYPLVLHKNGNPMDNRLENLYWGTYKDNTNDARRQGTLYIKNSKLNIHKVKLIRLLRRSFHWPVKNLADTFFVSIGTIEAVIYNRWWNHN